MKNKTGVEWLIEQINHTGWGNIMIDIPKEIIEQAKEIEKQQILDAYDEGYIDRGYEDHRANHYYNETFK